ncbi:hypothetical protein [Streptomyces sp. NPDC005989]|uniref:hypothetical protein n=1 Tax=Streptomyces sp. NPDC005989 TaxID=3156727 RepID=UPI0033F392DB
MSVPGAISDLDKNRALAEWLEWQLRQVRGRIRELEIKEEQERRRREQAHAALRWKIQPVVVGGPGAPRGLCPVSGRGRIPHP